MRSTRIGHVVAVALLLFGCSDNTQPNSRDAAVPFADAPPDRASSDLASAADQAADTPLADVTKDLAADARVDQAGRQDVASERFVVAETATIDIASFDDAGVDVAGVDVARVDVAGAEAAAGDGQTSLDGQTTMDALESVVGFPCRDDGDCCTAVDSCMARTYLYSRAPGANPKPTFPVATGGCLACIPSAVQLRCVSSQCFGERVSSYDSSLYNAHCGYVGLPDAGAGVLFNVVDASTPVIATKTSWTCGG